MRLTGRDVVESRREDAGVLTVRERQLHAEQAEASHLRIKNSNNSSASRQLSARKSHEHLSKCGRKKKKKNTTYVHNLTTRSHPHTSSSCKEGAVIRLSGTQRAARAYAFTPRNVCEETILYDLSEKRNCNFEKQHKNKVTGSEAGSPGCRERRGLLMTSSDQQVEGCWEPAISLRRGR